MPVLFVSKEVCEVRRMETFSAFRRMEVRMLMAEEIEAAFSRLGLSCARHYMQITRERAQQTVPHKGILPEKNPCMKRNGVSGHVRQTQDVPQRLMERSL